MRTLSICRSVVLSVGVMASTAGLAFGQGSDFDGEGKTDIAVWFKATGEWHIVDSQTSETRSEILGRPDEQPIQAFNVMKQ